MTKCIGIDFGMQNLKVCYCDGRKIMNVDLEGNQQSQVVRNAIYYFER